MSAEPIIVVGAAGILFVTVNVLAALIPHGLTALTLIAPDTKALSKLTVMIVSP